MLGTHPGPSPSPQPSCWLFTTVLHLFLSWERERITPVSEPRRANKPLIVQGIVSSR